MTMAASPAMTFTPNPPPSPETITEAPPRWQLAPRACTTCRLLLMSAPQFVVHQPHRVDVRCDRLAHLAASSYHPLPSHTVSSHRPSPLQRKEDTQPSAITNVISKCILEQRPHRPRGRVRTHNITQQFTQKIIQNNTIHLRLDQTALMWLGGTLRY